MGRRREGEEKERRGARINAKISAGQGGEAGGKNMQREGLYLYYRYLHGDRLCLARNFGNSWY